MTLGASPDVKEEGDSDDEGDIRMSDDEDEKMDRGSSPASLTPLEANGDSLKRKRELDREADGGPMEGSRTPTKRLKSHSPPPPPPPPPPADVSGDASAATSPRDALEHDDGAFASKTMADVLASAQQDTGDDADVTLDDTNVGTSEPNGHPDAIANDLHTSFPSAQRLPHGPNEPDPENRIDQDYEGRRTCGLKHSIETGAG